MRERLGVVEQKVLGALLLLANDEGYAHTKSNQVIADKMGYKHTGGSLTYALRFLEYNNYISKEEKGVYRILI